VRHRWGLQAAGIAIGLATAMALAGTGAALAQNIDLPVPRVTIYPGETISADQLADRAFIASTVTRTSIVDDKRMLSGRVARRTLLPGQPVQINAIRDPYLVNQGKSSLVVFQNAELTITTQAVALDNGGAGDVVKLRNPDSGLVIQGTVDRDGTVRLEAQ
jgi:flagellar basal body P-ring formation protein FlgA